MVAEMSQAVETDEAVDAHEAASWVRSKRPYVGSTTAAQISVGSAAM
jgi:hypothetical protein